MPDRTGDTARTGGLHDRLRALPSVDDVLRWPALGDALSSYGHAALTRAARAAVAEARQALKSGDPRVVDAADVLRHLERAAARSLRPVINATGVVLHTNLGRAPLAASALRAAVEVGGGYSNLEFDLPAGERGSRYDHARARCRALFGCEDALVVNNNAAAVLLALSALSAGREAVVSRGELVEIGGGFRIPEVITQGGARLHEVGTTNRTRPADYEAVLGPDTGVLLKVHRSNFAVVGFTEEADVAALAALARARGIPLVVDLGTGRLIDNAPPAAGEPTVARVLEDGADLVLCSGDKLLGGPQAGMILGRRDLVEACRRHPLCRALRVDKLTLAALEETLRLHQDGRGDDIPVVRMMRIPLLELRNRAEHLQRLLAARGVSCGVRDVMGKPGGGTLPLTELPSAAVVLDGAAHALAARLRASEPPVVARVEDGRVLLDVRCVFPEEEETLVAAVIRAVGEPGARA